MYQQSPGTYFYHVTLFVCIIYLLLLGTDVMSIVLYGKGIAKRIQVLLLLPILATTILYFRHLVRGAFASPEILILLCLAMLSVTWSDFQMHSLQRCIPLVVTTVFGLSLGSMMTLRGLMLFFAVFFAASMILAVGAIAALPQARGLPPWTDTINGIYLHKNGLGLASMMALLTSYHASQLFEGKLKLAFIATMYLALLLLIGSESRSSQIIAMFAMPALMISTRMPRKEILWAVGFIVISAFLIGFATFILTSVFAEPLFTLIGRKPTLSERIPIWELVWPYVLDHFWFGYGYGAFWHEEAAYLRVFSNKANLGFLPFYSHNGLLETFLNVGMIGVILLFFALSRFFFSTFYCLLFIHDRESVVFAFVLGMVFFFSNITESTVLERSSANWIFFVAFTTKINLVSLALREEKKKYFI